MINFAPTASYSLYSLHYRTSSPISMQLTNILTVAILAFGASAMLAAEPNAAVEARTLGYIECTKEAGKWDWFKFKCEYPQPEYPTYPPSCSKGKKWYEDKKNCDYPPWDPPTCYKPEHGWCSKSKNEYTTYNKGHDWCKKSGWNKVWCSDDHDAPEECKEHY
ncbi:hypothetical protein BKA65DRAFT_498428 [Rhexocercosporidium sp. MPI-PUGE-AT-0058]|nr:hypothetical protein BKA65DRAFT_498428 [Rhexocercosporidium sp. MPI-PUGE-AT-0058]